jgi:hypothetical protein
MVFGVVPRASHRGRPPAPGNPPGPLARAPVALSAAALIACTLAVGCGSTRQDVHEPAGFFSVRVVTASFRAKQAIAVPTTLTLRVTNVGTRTAPNVAVTVDSFYYTAHFPQLAASQRPVWVIERGPGAIATPPVESVAVSPPGGGQTAYVNTWALGPLAAGETRTFRWRVVPVKAGVHTLHFRVAAGLAGRAKAQIVRGAALRGRFTVAIAPAPPPRHVNPNTGKVVPGRYPVAP